MLFNSLEFFVFFAIVYLLYRALKFRWQNYMLLFVSYIFYGWWDWRFLFLMAFSTVIDFWIGLTMDRGRLTTADKTKSAGFLMFSAVVFLGLNEHAVLPGDGKLVDPATLINWAVMPWAIIGTAAYLVVMLLAYQWTIRQSEDRRRWLCLMTSVVTQIALLGTFKYFNFFADSLVTALQSIGFNASTSHFNVILPVGISFYTFQSLSYSIDIYRRELKPTNRFLDFALFVAYFPQLVAGPINRARQLIPQLANPRVLSWDQTMRGVYLIVLGLFKKVAIADGVAPIVNQIYGSSGTVSWIDIVVGTVLFAVQIYCDFSGYSDMARGVSKMFGVELMINFKLPYFAKDPSDFWQRWHISLSTWLRDYLYIPLGGNRGGLYFTCRNLMATMVLGGLWHGAAWNYVIWGFYHGTLLTAFRVRSEKMPRLLALPRSMFGNALAIAGFFVLTCYGWLLFRATSFDQIVRFTTALFTDFGNLDYGGGMPRISALFGMLLLAGIEMYQHWRNDRLAEMKLPAILFGGLIAAMLFATFMGMSNEPAQFIYFQF